jgi:TPR repeat protein
MAAQAGDVPAMDEVNMRYRHSYGLVKNIAEADVWRQRAASGGHAEAAQAMAHTYGVVTSRGAVISTDKNADVGASSRPLVTWLSRAAESGSAAAKHELALVRLFGISRGSRNKTSYLVPLASATAATMQLLIENADSGYWASQQALAELYQTGYADIKPNLIESNKWWQRLNEHSDASVQASIGAHYLAGDANQHLAGEKNKWQGKSLSYEDTNQIAFE